MTLARQQDEARQVSQSINQRRDLARQTATRAADRLIESSPLGRIENSQAKWITGLAAQDGVADAYVCRRRPLTCLAPDMVEAILAGRQTKGLKAYSVKR